MSLTIERKLPLILFFVVVVMTLLGFVLYQHTTGLQDKADLEKRRQTVVSKLDEALRLTLDSESALNSFVITGNDTYLDRYRAAKPRIPQVLAQVRALVVDAPVELRDVQSLEQWTSEYISLIDDKIELRKIDGFEATIATLGNSPERQLTSNIRATIERLKNAELTSLQQTEKSLDQSFYQTIWVLILGCVVGIVALVVANLSVSREIGKRRIAEAALKDANKDLEGRIEERTKELEIVNDSLQKAAGEREEILKNEQNARREAEVANRLRDEFMATVSHELKTPLNSILGWARMLKAGDLDESQVKKALGTIIKNSETQNRLIEDLLDVARIISGKLVLEFESIEAVDLLHDAVEIVKPSAQAKRIEITQTAGIGTDDVAIRGDRNRLMQVFSNLLTNAVKFTPEGGSVDVFVNVSGGKLDVEIRDNGIGINPEFLPAVFERFRQDTSRTTSNGGLGLGLAIVRQLVEMHGGTVTVASEGKDMGSTFTVRLPAPHQEDSPQERPVVPIAALHGSDRIRS